MAQSNLPIMEDLGPVAIGPSRSIGKVVDLNTTTDHPHGDHLLRINRSTGRSMDSFQFIDLNGDDEMDMVFRLYNGTASLNENRTYICAVLGPLSRNATYDLSRLPKWTVPFRVKSLLICNVDGDGAVELIIAKKQYKGTDRTDNSSFVCYGGRNGRPGAFPWDSPSFWVWLDPSENRTAENASLMDVNGDDLLDLLLQTRTWYRKRPQDYWALPTNRYLIMDGNRILSGNLTREDLASELVADRQDGSVLGSVYLDHPLRSGNLMGGGGKEIVSLERNFRPPTGGTVRGAVMVVPPLDLSDSTIHAKGNITSTVLGITNDGTTSRQPTGLVITDLSKDGYDDVMVTMLSTAPNVPSQQILLFNGSVSFPAAWDLSKERPSSMIEGFSVLATDHDGDGLKDLFVGYYRDSIANRSSCGVIRGLLDASSLPPEVSGSDLDNISVIGGRTNDEIGRSMSSFDLDGDGRHELLLLSGTQSMYADLHIVKGLTIGPPIVTGVEGLPTECYRGEPVEVEVFATDPQNYPRYLAFDIEARIAEGDWTIPNIEQVDQNFSYEEPYEGSTLITFIVPLENRVGMLDLRVRVTNTFGTTSDWREFKDLSEVINHVPEFEEGSISMTPKEAFRGQSVELTGHVIERDDVLDLSGEIWTLSPAGWLLRAGLDFGPDGNFSGSLGIDGSMALGEHRVKLSVRDDNGGLCENDGLLLEVLPRTLDVSVRVEGDTFLRGETIDADLSIASDMGSIQVHMELVGPSKRTMYDATFPAGNSSLPLSLPLDMDTGGHTLEFTAYDGTWTDSGSLGRNVSISNNMPVMALLGTMVMDDLSGTLDLTSMASDKEDGGGLSWSVVSSEDGLNAFFIDPSGILYVDLSDNASREVVLRIEDRDGGHDTGVLIVGSLWKAPPIQFTIRVTGPLEEPVVGANVTLSIAGSLIDEGTTSGNGTVLLRIPVGGSYRVRVEPPEQSRFQEGLRSGYVVFDSEMDIDDGSDIYEIRLAHRTVQVSTPASLTVTVKDLRGLPVEGALVSIKGPLNASQDCDASGTATFDDLPPGNYTCTASFKGIVSQMAYVTMVYGEDMSLDIVLGIGEEVVEDDDEFPVLGFIMVCAVAGILIGAVILFFMGRKGKKDGSVEE